MKKTIVFSILIIFLSFKTQCALGVDVSQLFSTSTYQCMKSNGYSFAIIRSYHSTGTFDTNVNQGLKNAKAAGLSTDIYMFPCRGKNASAQVDDMIKQVENNLYGQVWIDVQTNPSSGCSWSGHTSASNCQFLTEIVNKVKSHGKSVGIYASRYMWQSIFGSFGACTSVASSSLWYAHYDNSASFSDFVAFGGWTKPHIKQYQGDTTLCGVGVDKNYRA